MATVVISAQELVSNFNEFRRRKLRKRDFTYDRIHQETAWAVNLNCIQYYGRSDEPEVAKLLARQHAEHEQAIKLILESK